MAYHIGNECYKCGTCANNCPMGAISMVNGKYVIDSQKCISCGLCAAVCPVGAPKPSAK